MMISARSRDQQAHCDPLGRGGAPPAPPAAANERPAASAVANERPAAIAASMTQRGDECRCQQHVQEYPRDWARHVRTPSYRELFTSKTYVLGYEPWPDAEDTQVWLITPIPAEKGRHPDYNWMWTTGDSRGPLLIEGHDRESIIERLILSCGRAPPNVVR